MPVLGLTIEIAAPVVEEERAFWLAVGLEDRGGEPSAERTLRAPDVRFALRIRSGAEPDGSVARSIRFELDVPNLEEVRRRLEALPAPYVSPPAEDARGRRSCEATSPSGYTVVLREAPAR